MLFGRESVECGEVEHRVDGCDVCVGEVHVVDGEYDLVAWDGATTRRVGLGRVIFDAWLMARGLLSTSEKVILA